jgi:RNA recognition motif-containing protein
MHISVLGRRGWGMGLPPLTAAAWPRWPPSVCRVPWQTDDSTLQQHFSQFGGVDEAQIMREKYTGKSRGFGFVTFRSTSEGPSAAQHPGACVSRLSHRTWGGP